jgi:hypothetical protein
MFIRVPVAGTKHKPAVAPGFYPVIAAIHGLFPTRHHPVNQKISS